MLDSGSKDREFDIHRRRSVVSMSSKTIYPLPHRKTGNRSDMTEKLLTET